MNLIPFKYESYPIRVIEQNGEPWFVLADLCKALDLSTPAKVAERLDDDQKGMNQIHTPGGLQNMTVVNEAGMYDVVLRSDKKQAKPFRRWITNEVLPSIRKTGSYSMAAHIRPEHMAMIPKTYADALHALAREVEANEATKAYARELEPKADSYDKFINAEGLYPMGVAAKMLGTGQNRLFTMCRNAGIFIAKGAMKNTPYQQYMHHFEVKACQIHHSDGSSETRYTTKVQPSGLKFLADKLGLALSENVRKAA